MRFENRNRMDDPLIGDVILYQLILPIHYRLRGCITVAQNTILVDAEPLEGIA
jgi:hypothetical protein